MKEITIERISQYKSNGQRAEQDMAYHMTGEIRTADHVPFDVDSDIPEFHMSVKSSRFTLASGNVMKAQDFNGQLDEYFERTASECVAYVTNGDKAYIMDMIEFRSMLEQFGKFERDSEKNGGKGKVRFPAENKKILGWLAERV